MNTCPPPPTTQLGYITRQWTRTYGFLRRKKTTITVVCQQVPPTKEYTSPLSALTAEVKIFTNAEQYVSKKDPNVTIKIPFQGLVGNAMLPLQVYLFTQSSMGKDNLWKDILLNFCSLMDGFDKNGHPTDLTIFWNEEQTS